MSNRATLQGVIIRVLPEQGGVSKAGNNWRKQVFILQTGDGEYARQIAIQMFNDRIRPVQTGTAVSVDAAIESREYNGRWYTDVNLLGIAPLDTPAPVAPQQQYAPQQQHAQQQYAQPRPRQDYRPQPPLETKVDTNELPF